MRYLSRQLCSSNLIWNEMARSLYGERAMDRAVGCRDHRAFAD